MADNSDFKEKAADLEKILRNIVAIGYSRETPAHRMLRMLDVAEQAITDIEDKRREENRAAALKNEPSPF